MYVEGFITAVPKENRELIESLNAGKMMCHTE
jgi:uncharacterized protein YbaA (DUF1428 family)